MLFHPLNGFNVTLRVFEKNRIFDEKSRDFASNPLGGQIFKNHIFHSKNRSFQKPSHFQGMITAAFGGSLGSLLHPLNSFNVTLGAFEKKRFLMKKNETLPY